MSWNWVGFHHPLVRLRAQVEDYYARCLTVGLTRDEARAVLIGVQHLAQKLPYVIDVLDVAYQAALELNLKKGGDTMPDTPDDPGPESPGPYDPHPTPDDNGNDDD